MFALLCPLLSACSLSPVINHQALDYFQANDLAANQIILLNILRAKEGAPLHFSELSQIRGQLTVAASASTTLPYGPVSHATQLVRKLGTFGVTISSAPSFDISSLDTKDFTDGVMTPISPQTAEFFLDEGIDYRMVLMLLVSGIRPAGSNEMLLNAPESSREVCYKEQPAYNATPVGDVKTTSFSVTSVSNGCAKQYREPEYFTFLRVIDNIPQGALYPVSVPQLPRPVGAPFSLDMGKNLKTITGIDPTKYTLTQIKSGPDKGKFQLMRASKGSSIVLCEATASVPVVVSALENNDGAEVQVPANACDPNQGGDADDSEAGTPPAKPITIGKDSGTFVLKLRSTLEVIQYVGQVLALQDRLTYDDPSYNPDHIEQCITLQTQRREGGDAKPTCTGGGELFHLQNTSGEVDLSSVGINSAGQTWSLPPPVDCAAVGFSDCSDPEKYDHTLETMSIIALLLNQNKSAKDINTTPAVQAVP